MTPVTGPGPPVALRPRPRDRVDLHDFWHARHLSNLPRPYTNLIREVVSQIIGTGGISEAPRTVHSAKRNSLCRRSTPARHLALGEQARAETDAPAEPGAGTGEKSSLDHPGRALSHAISFDRSSRARLPRRLRSHLKQGVFNAVQTVDFTRTGTEILASL